MTIAAEHAGEAADMLRTAVAIEDPYRRADVVWEALERVRCAAGHLPAAHSSVCTAVIARLDDGGDGSAEPIPDNALEECAHALDDMAQTLDGITPVPRAHSGRRRSPAGTLDRPSTTATTRPHRDPEHGYAARPAVRGPGAPA